VGRQTLMVAIYRALTLACDLEVSANSDCEQFAPPGLNLLKPSFRTLRLNSRKALFSLPEALFLLFHRVAQLEQNRIGIGETDETLGGVLDL
jgi:hypothetical protein